MPDGFHITEEDALILREYLEEAQRLVRYRVISEGQLSHLSVSFHAEEKGVGAQLSGPDEEALEAMYSSLRKLISPGEQVFFQRIANVVCKVTHTIEPDVAKNTTGLKKEFERLKQGPEEMVAQFEGDRMTYEFCIDLLFNGRVFHRDRSRVEQLRRLQENPVGYQMFLFFAIAGLTDYVNLCIVLGNIVNYVLQNRQSA